MVTNRSVVLCYSKVKGVALRDALLGYNNNYLRLENDADLSSVEGLFRPSTEGVSAHMIESAYGGLMNYNELIAWAEEATAYIDEHYSGECNKETGQTLFAVMKVALCVKAGEMVYCYVG